MKKYFYLLGVLLLIPIFVLADSASPSIIGYDAIIVNKNGAKIKDENNKEKVIPYNTKIKIMDERNNCGYGCLKDDENCDYLGNFSIAMSDYLPLKDEIKPSDINKDELNTSTDEFIVFDDKGIKLNKGPSDAYGKYDVTIKYMSHLKAKYVIYSGGGETEANCWYYIDDGTNKGWLNSTVYYGNYTLGQKKDKIVSFKNTTIYDRNNMVVTTIKEETILNNVYYIERNKEYFIQYDNKEGFVKEKDFIYAEKTSDSVAIVLKNTGIISNGNAVMTLPLGTKINTLYGTYEQIGRYDYVFVGVVKDGKKYYYVEYEQVKGFVKESDIEIFSNDYYKDHQQDFKKQTVTLKDATKMYQEESLSNEIGVTIPKGTQLTTVYSYQSIEYDDMDNSHYAMIYLVNYNNTKGWITVYDDTSNSKPNNANNNQNNTTENPNVVENKDNTIIYAVIGAIIAFVVSISAIIIINKKSDKKQVKKDNTNENTKTINKDNSLGNTSDDKKEKESELVDKDNLTKRK